VTNDVQFQVFRNHEINFSEVLQPSTRDPSKPLLLEGNRIVGHLRLSHPFDMMRLQIQGVSRFLALRDSRLTAGPEPAAWAAVNESNSKRTIQREETKVIRAISA
jgi:hypothetical protein